MFWFLELQPVLQASQLSLRSIEEFSPFFLASEDNSKNIQKLDTSLVFWEQPKSWASKVGADLTERLPS